ncbi:hypothetical protein AAHE18_13G375800 [Arachis hypogaea]
MAHNTSSDSDNEIITTQTKIFPHGKSIHEVLGGGKVADVLLWKDRNVSAAILVGITAIWFLFEVVEYNFVTLISHISITTMLVLYIWSTVADIFKWNGPKIPETILKDSFFEDLAFNLQRRFYQLLQVLFHISCGTDLPRLSSPSIYYQKLETTSALSICYTLVLSASKHCQLYMIDMRKKLGIWLNIS